MIPKSINTSLKLHFYIASIISIWLFVFIVFVKPFQDEPIDIYSWLTLAIGYSIVTFLSYMITALIINKNYRILKKWNLNYEIVLILSLYVISIMPSFIFHNSDFSNGDLSLWAFVYKIFIPSILIITPLIVFARRYLIKLFLKTNDEIKIKGDSKRDYLKIRNKDLICVSNAHNYVEIFFLNNGNLDKKLIRASLKKIENDIPNLIKVHRSHLINPSHFKTWKNQNTISLTQIEVPVSNSYKDIIMTL